MALNDLGDVPANSVLPLFFTSHDGATGANEALSGIAVTDIEIYKGVSMTQRASDAGYVLLDTDGIDLDAHVGVNGISIDLGDNTDAGFFAVGSFYNVILGPVTIDVQTVNIHLASFRIVTAEAVAGKPKVDVDAWLGTAASTPTVAGVPNVNTKTWNDLATVALPLIPTTAGRTLDVATTGEAGADFSNINGTLDAAEIGADAITAAKIAADVTTELNAPILAILGALADAAADGDPTSTDTVMMYIKQLVNTLVGSAGVVTFPAAAAPANAVSLAEILRSIYDDTNALPDSGALTTLQADTDNIQTRLPAALVGGRMDSSVGAMAANVLTAAATATDFGTEIAAAIWDALTSGIVTASSIGKQLKDNLDVVLSTRATPAQVNTEVVDALNVDTYAEPGQGAPTATPTIRQMAHYLYKAWRNKKTQSSTETKLFADDATTVDQKSTVSDDGTTATVGEIATGP